MKHPMMIVALSILGLLVLTGLVGGTCYGCPRYAVYEQHLQGEAEYARADANRKIKTLEAQAAAESAKSLAQAEVERAKGVAQANQIIGDSLKGNESYLRYLWLQGLREGQDKEVIYVPTETNLPILEASRLATGTANRESSAAHNERSNKP